MREAGMGWGGGGGGSTAAIANHVQTSTKLQ